MGRGDRKSRRGKINVGSYGKTRPRKIKKPIQTKIEAIKVEIK